MYQKSIKKQKRQKTNLHICVNAQRKISSIELFSAFPDLFRPWTNIIDPKCFDLSHSCHITTGYWAPLLIILAATAYPNLKKILSIFSIFWTVFRWFLHRYEATNSRRWIFGNVKHKQNTLFTFEFYLLANTHHRKYSQQ